MHCIQRVLMAQGDPRRGGLASLKLPFGSACAVGAHCSVLGLVPPHDSIKAGLRALVAQKSSAQLDLELELDVPVDDADVAHVSKAAMAPEGGPPMRSATIG